MNVPKLRFKEFNDEWISYKFYDLVSIINGQVDPNKKEYCNLPHIGPGNIEKETGRLLEYNLAKDDKLISSKYLFNENSVIYGKINPHFAKVCYPKFAGLCSADAYPINPIEEKLTSTFLLYLLLNPKFTKFATSVSMRTGMPKINRDELGIYKFTIPKINEQIKIGKTLELLDKKIELQSKKIEDLKLFKLYLQNKLYNANDTKDVLIKDLGEIVTGTTPSKSENKYWDNGNILWITPTDICENRDINDCSCKLTESGLAKGRFIPKNSILVTCIASIGKNAIIKEDGSCNQQINAIIPSKDYNYNYIYYMIENLSNYMKSIAGTSATAIINKEQFGNINIKIHKREVQDKISKILNAFETKIIQEGFKYKKLQNLKKGLMQNMFV